jgi:hypothetical protein
MEAPRGAAIVSPRMIPADERTASYGLAKKDGKSGAHFGGGLV